LPVGAGLDTDSRPGPGQGKGLANGIEPVIWLSIFVTGVVW